MGDNELGVKNMRYQNETNGKTGIRNNSGSLKNVFGRFMASAPFLCRYQQVVRPELPSGIGIVRSNTSIVFDLGKCISLLSSIKCYHREKLAQSCS